MAIAHLCKRQFNSQDWSRGEDYFRRGKVSIYAKVQDGLEALVIGSEPRPYQVSLDWSQCEAGVLQANCTCPRFDDQCECKHVAATILEADRTNATKGLTALRTLEVLPFGDSDQYQSHRQQKEDEDEWRDEDESAYSIAPRHEAIVASNGEAKRQVSNWKTALQSVGGQFDELHAASRPVEAEQRLTYFILDLHRTSQIGKLCVVLRQRQKKKDGTLGVFRSPPSYSFHSDRSHTPETKQILELLQSTAQNAGYSGYGYGYGYRYGAYNQSDEFQINPALHDAILPLLAATGRFLMISSINQLDNSRDPEEPVSLNWDGAPPWKLKLIVAPKTKQAGNGDGWEMRGKLERQTTTGAIEIRELSEPQLLTAFGIVIFSDHIARYESGGDFAWTAALRKAPVLIVPARDTTRFQNLLARTKSLPPIELPAELKWREVTPLPMPSLAINKPKRKWDTDLECHLSFAYGDHVADHGNGVAVWFDPASRLATRRNWEQETALHQHLLDLGIKLGATYGRDRECLRLLPNKMPAIVQQLTAEGWQVVAEGRAIRKATNFAVSVTSTGLDWFDLDAKCDFGETTASLPQLLEALKKDDGFIELDDGSQGILPEEWLRRYAAIGKLGKREGDALRYTRTQAVLLDTLLMEDDRTKVSIDKSFAQLRQKLKSFSGIKSASPPATFKGELRPYQKEGLGWLHYLDEFGFGGCLADDMGLGKTVQVLAMLEKRRIARARANAAAKGKKAQPIGPSLVVVPKSLVFNWIEEAKRFTPKLKVLNFTGLGRREFVSQIPDHDLVITTYSTMRLEIEKLRDYEFDYLILDESQAIKNSASQAAKASLLLKGRRRLAMSGTPIENHLGELQSLLEFLNPGLLGSVTRLSDLFASEQRMRPALAADAPSEEKNAQAIDPQVSSLGRAIRPFLLRRTKEQVLKELPAKTEQTLYCELPQEQRALYDELKRHYRDSLLNRVDKFGLKKSKIQVLEALLRLRQAACHPGLLNEKKKAGGSAKLESLMERIAEVVEEGHKALVFSQFTSFLSIVRTELEKQKLVYEYLDGKTTKRQAKVDRFQTDSQCPLFLISLKAGGLGLNLTAADYVFILDPWWNPAVEAQAVDRAHRMGQKKHVFAYRLIAKDTVEEKILSLQQQKRHLADAIVNAESSLIQSLTSEDLQLLLS